ncbi:MAG: NTP transferase domain-containing protein [Bacteroidetes bacterium]|nr:NTP transferase domain-containing protein [Bacteroidota bacterium]MBS1629070.1 NTP transferase domain-containing protein [Bacteroidota bacterium]
MKAMLLAAGLGTRLAPFTHHHPKALAQVQGRSLLEWNVRYLQQFGIREVVVNVHHFADQIEEAVCAGKGWGSKVLISDERSAVLETGGGLKHATHFFETETAFLVMNVDVLTNLDISALQAAHAAGKAQATLAVMQRPSSRYLLFDEKLWLCGWRNTKTGELRGLPGTDFAFSGIQIISGDLLRGIHRDGKFSLIDVYLDALAAGGKIQGFDHSNDLFLDAGKPETLAQAQSFPAPAGKA